jgi:hypothetical protein
VGALAESEKQLMMDDHVCADEGCKEEITDDSDDLLCCESVTHVNLLYVQLILFLDYY